MSRCCAGHPDAIVAAVCDAQVDVAAAMAAATGATAYTDWEAMFEAEPLDGVFVCTPPAVHLGPAGAGVRAGRPGVPREAAGAVARRRRGDRRGLAGERRAVRRRLPVAQRRPARPPSRRAGRGFAGPAREPEPRADRARPGRRVVRRRAGERRHPLRARKPRHRPPARHRGAGDGGPGRFGCGPAGDRGGGGARARRRRRDRHALRGRRPGRRRAGVDRGSGSGGLLARRDGR